MPPSTKKGAGGAPAENADSALQPSSAEPSAGGADAASQDDAGGQQQPAQQPEVSLLERRAAARAARAVAAARPKPTLIFPVDVLVHNESAIALVEPETGVFLSPGAATPLKVNDSDALHRLKDAISALAAAKGIESSKLKIDVTAA